MRLSQSARVLLVLNADEQAQTLELALKLLEGASVLAYSLQEGYYLGAALMIAGGIVESLFKLLTKSLKAFRIGVDFGLFDHAIA